MCDLPELGKIIFLISSVVFIVGIVIGVSIGVTRKIK